jgi:hypothetical protein
MALKTINDFLTEGTHIVFHHTGTATRERKTNVYEVHPINEIEILGAVRWFGRWRKYCFFPRPDTVYEETCLGEIAEFCVRETKNHRLKKKEERTDEYRD